MKLSKASIHDICVEATRIFEGGHYMCFQSGLRRVEIAGQLAKRLENMEVQEEKS
jgi:hypothetical protein